MSNETEATPETVHELVGRIHHYGHGDKVKEIRAFVDAALAAKSAELQIRTTERDEQGRINEVLTLDKEALESELSALNQERDKTVARLRADFENANAAADVAGREARAERTRREQAERDADNWKICASAYEKARDAALTRAEQAEAALEEAKRDGERFKLMNRFHISLERYGYRGRDGWEARVADPSGHYQEERTKQIGTGVTAVEALNEALTYYARIFPEIDAAIAAAKEPK